MFVVSMLIILGFLFFFFLNNLIPFHCLASHLQVGVYDSGFSLRRGYFLIYAL